MISLSHRDISATLQSMLIPMISKPGSYLHINVFIEVTVKKCGNEVHLVALEIEISNDGE